MIKMTRIFTGTRQGVGSIRKGIGSVLATLATLLLSLALAVVIWATAVRSADPIQSESLQLPVQTSNLPTDAVLLSLGQETVLVVVEGPASALGQLAPDNFTAVVDLSQIPFGQSEAEIQVQSNVEDVTLVSQFPQVVSVNMERLVSRDVPVVPDIRGDVARGHERGQPLVEPASIRITGPSSRVEPLAEARVTVFLDGSRQTVVVSARPVFRDRQGNVASVNGLNLSAEQVEVTVPVDELAGFAEKPITVNWEGEPAAGYRLLNVSVEPPSVLVTGRPTELETSRIQTEPVDITGLTESLTQTVALDLPEGIILEDQQQPIVVYFEIEPILTSAVVAKAPTLRALGEGLTATVEPEEVRVFLFGPLPVLEALEEDDVRVTLDLLGLESGTYQIEPIVVVSANDVEQRSYQPRFMTVVITEVITPTGQPIESLWLGTEDWGMGTGARHVANVTYIYGCHLATLSPCHPPRREVLI